MISGSAKNANSESKQGKADGISDVRKEWHHDINALQVQTEEDTFSECTHGKMMHTHACIKWSVLSRWAGEGSQT